MKQKTSLDIAKFLCAILVLLIHVNPFGSYSKLLTFGLRNIVCVVAVPFFFCTSGYLLADKLNSLEDGAKRGYIGKYLTRLLTIYLFWSAVYFPFVIIKWVREGFSFLLVLNYIKEFIFEGSYSTIWFLPALLAASGAYYLLRQKMSSKKVFLIGCGFYVITLLLSSYYGITERIPGLAQLGQLYYGFFDSVKNGLLFGLVFVAMGGMIREEQFFSRMTRKQALIGMIVSFIVLCGEVLVTRVFGNLKGVDTLASLLPMTIMAMVFTLSFDVPPSDLCLSLRKYSMLIFLCQRIPISVIELFLADTVLATNSVVSFLTVTAATIGISYLILRLSGKYRWMKKFY